MLVGTVMLHGIPANSSIGIEKCGQKYAIATSGVIDAFATDSRFLDPVLDTFFAPPPTPTER
jgi:hypothetical protein